MSRKDAGRILARMISAQLELQDAWIEAMRELVGDATRDNYPLFDGLDEALKMLCGYAQGEVSRLTGRERAIRLEQIFEDFRFFALPWVERVAEIKAAQMAEARKTAPPDTSGEFAEDEDEKPLGSNLVQ